ncbi:MULTISPECIES: ABC transporter ATP-binding protein [unclassified Devosia]|uniref:ABC transporter ATP-binding protein n=1 Tax=unclassified Devosia TaxID=196773 RepID=UPI00086AEE23|nr:MULTISPECIES: ABC transporter ATP-binding protein [unclassified Devosia]MBN9360833.1 ABC transporter ATP-binding protein [Devosia sp.]ODS88187.1 MAG: multidrug ABC transporter [Devosia sp. SCN 66-27]OJX22786.1 MAG: multidrug ABC transporter [Devosia sp. 66-14]
MSYKLNTSEASQSKETVWKGLARLLPLIKGEGRNVAIALAAILISSATTLTAPLIIGHTVDSFISTGDLNGVLLWSGLLLAVYAVGLVSAYTQTRTMGGVARRILFNLRNAIFNKLQELPVAFFNQNRSGDLISRINNDTDKLNQFFAQALMQFLGNAFLIVGAGILLLVLNVRLGGAALLPAVAVLVVTQLIGGWVKRASFKSLQTLGGLSGEIQESLANFKVIVAFNRFDYFRDKFAAANATNYAASIRAGIASNIFIPIYGLAYNLGQLVVLAYGIYLISSGELTTGLLIGFLLYVTNFYNPLRQLASIWSSLQLALAGLDRISEVLALQSDMATVPAEATTSTAAIAFDNVSFHYPDGAEVLKSVSFTLERGKTYALVGPTGGGKTTTASLMARLYDPTAGTVLLDGRDIRSYPPEERVAKIGFILQEPFLFTGTVRDNILYGTPQYASLSDEALERNLDEAGLSALLARFEDGLATKVSATGDAMSLGQKQLIAFIRATLRRPEILILDEATANIDTVTEQLLQGILKRLPATTTRVIIAHRLNTIDSADAIFFVNGGAVTLAGSMERAIDMLLHGAMVS